MNSVEAEARRESIQLQKDARKAAIQFQKILANLKMKNEASLVFEAFNDSAIEPVDSDLAFPETRLWSTHILRSKLNNENLYNL